LVGQNDNYKEINKESLILAEIYYTRAIIRERFK